ncbi:type III-B CRISPR-associated protein Cas10/Cmr2 [Scytonema hofmannii PCC 7110]|uniref:Type III-B CRISPR-associated protein Cas10/Cmr2 n=1 Tax=Scytonema hofmannii PCC 7110 TaxID=128403 RepID=A0A139XGZ2_9CYAN|nr:type III-B CRISPR-associated protein Cas10/Cmr2 [Scytonema hofmannii]KYC43960.1 type III-B CRISPR-associated protein Cas10/Cmr2 [Scytonema hofmannii PCC 7110]
MKLNSFSQTDIGLAWCLLCNDAGNDKSAMQKMQQQLQAEGEVPIEIIPYLEQVQMLRKLPFPKTVEELKKYQQDYPQFWNSQVGLVYGGATKIKQYVFEAAKLPDIRGASALLDRINLIDLPAFFGCENHPDYEQCQRAKDYCQKVREDWLDKSENFPELSKVLIPELIIYSTGGNILAFCPAAFVNDLANAIEKRYTEETLTANSCAVGDTFKPLEIIFGRLPKKNDDQTFWLEKCCENWDNKSFNPLIKGYFEQIDTSPEQAFRERKTFNELAGKLASLFNQRRNGNSLPEHDRPSRQYPPMFETHPYLKRDEGDRRSAVMQAKTSPDDSSQGLPGDPWFSEASARKRLVGQIAKRDNSSTKWYEQTGFDWEPGSEAVIETWVNKFERFLYKTPHKYYGKIRSENLHPNRVKEAMSVREIGDASTSSGFVAYIYADGNNMGGYIQKKIQNPEDYKQFSRDIFDATEKSVYAALTEHLEPHKLNSNLQAERKSIKEVWIHPFEILTIGGDDVMLIVPADKALAIAKTIGEEFERRLAEIENYKLPQRCFFHRYQPQSSLASQCQLSMSTGVLIAAENTPIYYAQKLTEQLLKSAKKQAKDLKKYGYYGGTIDFLVMKAVTMISSNINEFRANGLTKSGTGKQKLKLYAAPYTLHELGGLLETAKVLKNADFPKSQLYQIRSLLERSKQTAMLNYRYFKVRLSDKKAQNFLTTQFEDAWCKPKDPTNNGNLAPWMSLKEGKEETEEKVTYETIWRELVDLYPFIEKSQDKLNSAKSQQPTLAS